MQFNTGQEPNSSVANEAISVAVRPHGATSARQWITTHNGQPDILFATNAGFGHRKIERKIVLAGNGGESLVTNAAANIGVGRRRAANLDG